MAIIIVIPVVVG